MNVLFYGIGLIFIAFSIHLIIWRIRLPRNQTKALLSIFFATLIIGILILGKFSAYISFLGIPAPATIYEYLQLCFFFVSLTFAYIATYSALEVDSPSLVMVTTIAKAGPDGLDKNTLEQKMGDALLIVPRLRDLVAGGMVCLDEELYRLNQKGILIAHIFTGYRKLLKKTQKGG